MDLKNIFTWGQKKNAIFLLGRTQFSGIGVLPAFSGLGRSIPREEVKGEGDSGAAGRV